jgi:hypothetical protein
VCEKIGEELEIAYDVLYTFQHQYVGVKECTSHHDLGLEPYSADWYDKKIP